MKRAFSNEYGVLRQSAGRVCERAALITENLLQEAWRMQPWPAGELRTLEGHRISVISPGWPNRQEGPDFRSAQLVFNGTLHSGDVEVHLRPSGWRSHGHHEDNRYNDVILHVVYATERGDTSISTQSGRTVATLALESLLTEQLIDTLVPDPSPVARAPDALCGRCAATVGIDAPQRMLAFLRLAAEWRMLAKARAFQDRADSAGLDQALYESFMTACGYSRFKKEFQVLARQLPYDRARQLAQYDPLTLETALFAMAGLLPSMLSEPVTPAAAEHHRRLVQLRETHVPGLRPLAVDWPRLGLRPANAPERRLSGAARIVARTAAEGLAATVEDVWRRPLCHKERMAVFEALFPRAMGFWAAHYSWAGKTQAKPVAIFGAARVLAIVGNVFLPAGLALARRKKDRILEEDLLAFFEWLPGEPDNAVTRQMRQWVLPGLQSRTSFQLQQGLIQMHHDWCDANPSCRNCSFARYFGETMR